MSHRFEKAQESIMLKLENRKPWEGCINNLCENGRCFKFSGFLWNSTVHMHIRTSLYFPIFKNFPVLFLYSY